MLGRSLFKFFRLSTSTNPSSFSSSSSSSSSSSNQPCFSDDYHQVQDVTQDENKKHNNRGTSSTQTTDPICIPINRRESTSSGCVVGEGSYDHDYMLVNVNQRLSKSADVEKFLRGTDMDQIDRIPVDFSAPSGPTVVTDPDEVGEILLHGESRAIYQDHSKIYGLAPCSVYRAERWFHQNADHDKAKRMLLRTGEKDGSFLIRINQRNCLVLTVCYHQKIYNIFINCKVEGHKTTLFIERSHQFSNLVDLINYYIKHQGLLLPCKLTRGVALRWPGSKKNGIENRLSAEE